MNQPLRPLLVMGTRPEAIKMAPIVARCREHVAIDPIVCFTGQHDTMLRQVTDYFGIEPDVDLKLMEPGQSLTRLTARALTALDETMEKFHPDCVVAQGDTTSVLAAAMVAFYRRLPLVHVEAGLRTGDLSAPWPEEYNRRVASITTALHCAPTEFAAAALEREGVSRAAIRVTGNTVIDALLETADRERARADHWQAKHAYLGDRPMVLITAHRRENHGAGLDSVFAAIAQLAHDFPQVSFVFPVHLNPQVQRAAAEHLASVPNVQRLDPLPYPEFVWMMDRAKLIVSDSGGVQEEAPSLRRPVLALRETTERSEAVDVGAVRLVGCDPMKLIASVRQLLTDDTAYRAMQVEHSPFGDGTAARQIIDWMLETWRPEHAAVELESSAVLAGGVASPS